MSVKKATQRSAKSATGKASKGFTAQERAAMRERARELRAHKNGADGESDVLAKIAAMPPADRALAERLHAIVQANAPDLSPRTWYGMPAYAKDGKVVCFFQSAQKFKTRYATFGFSDKANLDEGAMWPTYFALKELTAAEEGEDRRAREEGGELSATRAKPGRMAGLRLSPRYSATASARRERADPAPPAAASAAEPAGLGRRGTARRRSSG
jgi:uncharacterized protein YdhG (YjbR/CyaY superfamily)